jgi:hypothetical protein
MDLLKKREFGLLINDTFLFFREHGKAFLKHYFTINGIFLIVLVALIFLTFKYYLEALFANISNGNANNIDVYINNNPTLFITIAVVFFILIAILSIIGITMPILYLRKIAHNEEKSVTTKSMWLEIKQQKSKIVVFFLSLLVLLLPFGLIFWMMSQMPNFFLLWLPIYMVFLPAYIAWIFQSYFFYVNEENSILTSYLKGFENLKMQFWSILGCTIIMFIIIQVVQVILTIIPYLIMIFNLFVQPNPNNINANPDEHFSFISIIISVIFVLLLLSSYVLNNLIVISQGIIFYSCKEKRENLSTNHLIDSIGKTDL